MDGATWVLFFLGKERWWKAAHFGGWQSGSTQTRQSVIDFGCSMRNHEKPFDRSVRSDDGQRMVDGVVREEKKEEKRISLRQEAIYEKPRYQRIG